MTADGRRGSVKRDPRTDLWGFVVDLTPPGAKPRKQARRRGFATKKEAQAALDEIKSQLAKNAFVAPKRITLSDYLTKYWLPGAEPTVRRGTFESYRRTLRRHVIPHPIAGAQLQSITPPMCSVLYSDMLRGIDGRPAVGKRSVAYAASILHRAFRDAVRWQYLVRNPAEGASPPKPQKSERRQIRAWSGHDLGRFLHKTQEDRLAALWRLLATTGCRRGEALGIRWADLDLESGGASFVQTVIEVEDAPGYAFSAPKTAAGLRSIALDAETVTALRAHRKRQAEEQFAVGTGWRDHGLVFCRPDGEPLHPKSVSSLFTDAVNRHGLPHLSIHGLRHTWATLALASGKVSPRVVQERLGHSHVSITLGIYSHVTKGLDVAAAEEVAAMIARGSA